MRLRIAMGFCALALGASTAFAQQRNTLPLERVRLYETGVGYFERAGRLSANQDVALPVPAGHLDDALKTLVVLSKDGKTTVSGIDFGSSVSQSMARALAGLGPSGDAPVRYDELLESLKGARVEVRGGAGAFTGRLIDVLSGSESDDQECVPTSKLVVAGKKPASTGDCFLKTHTTLLLLTDRSEIRRFRAAEVASVRPIEPGFASRLGSALDALSDRGAQRERSLRVLASKGQTISLGYVAEAPLWRSSYRLVLGRDAKKATLQGWALVHNDTDEDWKQVEVELVNGRPDSFLFPLAAPRYARRQLVTPENELSTVPQLLGRTVDNMWGDESGEAFGSGGLGLSGVGMGGGGSGQGIGLGSIGTIGAGSGTGSSSLLSVGDLASVVKADGVESGALFRYTLKSPVDLRARGSALVPFFHDSIATRQIAVFESPGATARSAVRLKNDTSQTLPAGTIAVFAAGGFAGESAIDRMKPSETRFVEYGFDLDIELAKRQHETTDETRLFSYSGGKLHEHFVRRHRLTYQLTNKAGAPRSAYLVLPFVRNAKVLGADRVDFDARRGRALAVFEVDAKREVQRKIVAEEGRRTRHDELSSRKLRDFTDASKVPTKQKEVLSAAAEKLLRAEVLRGGMKKRKRDLSRLNQDIRRLRGHLKALGTNRTRAGDRLVERLLKAEDNAKRIRRRIDELDAEVDKRVAGAKKVLRRLGSGAP